MTETTGGRTVIAVTVAVVLVAVAVGVGSVPGAAQDADADLACVGSGGGAAYVTDSNLTVYENDTDATIDTFYFPDSETVRFEYTEDAVNLSATGTAQARLENATGTTTCLGDVNATDHDVTVAPDGENDVTLNGTFDGISFRDANFSAEDAGIDFAYDASDPTAVTVHNTSRQSGTEIVARSASDGSELDRGTVRADGSVTFDGLPSGEYDLDFEADSEGEFLTVSIVGVNESVTAGEDVVVDATVENTGSASGTQTVEFTVNGTTEASRSVSLDTGESTTETFTYTTDSSDTPAIEVGVESENETAIQTVSVTTPDPYAGGSGTESDPYEIANWHHLNNTRENLDANFTVVNDLNESTDGYDDVASETANGGKGFVPIGDSSTAFTGVFNGSNHTITGLYIERGRPDTDGTGLFGNTGMGAVIENVGLEDANVSNANNRVGALVGNNTGTVHSAYATGNVSGSGKVGGLVGENKEGGTVNASHATATVSSDSDCDPAPGDGCIVGGLVGDNGGTVDRSYATGNVSGDDYVGGLVGSNFIGPREGDGTVKRSYATGAVSGSNTVGGLVGQNSGTVELSYATGTVSGDTDVGGLVGENFETVTDAYWDVNTTNQTDGIGRSAENANGATGLTTDQLKGNESLAGFDYTSTWAIYNASQVSYPYLQANTQTPAPGLESVSTSANFEVTIADTNASVTAGGDVVVDATVENTGSASGTQTVEFTVNGTTEASRSVSLDTGESTTETFTYTTDSSDTPAIEVGVESENDTASEAVTIEAAGVTINAQVTDDEATADGADEVEFTVTVEDSNGDPIEGITVRVADSGDVSALGGIEAGDDAETDADGNVTFTATSTDTGEFTIVFEEQNEERSDDATATFVAGDADSVTIVTQPTETTAGETIMGPPKVEVADGEDNPVEDVEVSVEAINGSGSLSGTTEVTTDENGIATFDDLTIEDADKYQLQFTLNDTDDNVAGTVIVSSDEFDIVPADADSLTIIDPPTTITAGDPFELTLEATDEFGNPAADQILDEFEVDSEFDGEVFSVNSLGLDADGKATVTIDAGEVVTADDEHILIADATAVGDNSVEITVEAGGVDRIELDPDTVQTITAGDSIDFEATAFDEFGNLVEDDDTAFAWQNTTDDGTFKQTIAGSYEVTAELDGVSSTPVTVTVEPATDPGPVPEPDPEPTRPPEANADAYVVVANTTLSMTADYGILANDSDPDTNNNDISVTVESGPANGTLDLDPDGSFTYVPDTGFTGTDSFTYEVSDGDGGQDTATVTISVMTAPIELTDPTVLENESVIRQQSTISANATLTAAESIVIPVTNVGPTRAQFTENSSVASIRFHTDTNGTVRVVEYAEPTPDYGDVPGSLLTALWVGGTPTIENTTATIRMRVSQTELQNVSVTASDIRLAHRVDGDWELVSTTVVSQTDERVLLEGTIEGFSPFAITAVSQPEVSITATPTPVTVGEELTLDAGATTSTGEVRSYEWSINGQSLSGETATLTPEDSGNYTVELTVTTDAGRTATATATVVVENETGSETTPDGTPDNSTRTDLSTPPTDDTQDNSTRTDLSTPPTDDTATRPETTTESSGPGFGLIVALVALAGVALLAIRKSQ